MSSGFLVGNRLIWLIALMVLCCGPLAIALTAAASAQRSITISD
jgi:hypothetical protein